VLTSEEGERGIERAGQEDTPVADGIEKLTADETEVVPEVQKAAPGSLVTTPVTDDGEEITIGMVTM